MPSDPAAALRDIQRNIDLATQFVAGMEYEAFRDDTRTVYAVTRCLEIISEASRRLLLRSWCGTPYNRPYHPCGMLSPLKIGALE
jgi:uncharacterized protein with HEPN domain